MDFSFFKNMFASKDDSGKKEPEESKPKGMEENVAEVEGELTEAQQAVAEEDVEFNENDGLSEPRRHSGRRQRRQNGRRRERSSREDKESDVPTLSDEETAALLSKLEEFVAYSAKSLVDSPELVTTKVVDREGGKLILVSCDKKDTGKIIGRSGKIIAAIRILVSGAASRNGLKATVDIDE